MLKQKITLMDWLKMPEGEVLDIFSQLLNAKRVKDNEDEFVYIPGIKPKKTLLIAHCDTVWGNQKLDIKYKNGKFYSRNNKVGIGADDRAGIAMLWQLRNSGHSILIPNGEEKHTCGSRFLMTMPEWKDIVNEHQFALEMDRRGNNDLIFYDVGSPEFTKWCEENFKGYKKAQGSWTDICVLCDKICGVNISVGYYEQHTSNEHLIESEWLNTLNTIRTVLEKNEIPQFIKPEKPKYLPPIHYYPQYNENTYHKMNEYDSYDDYYIRRFNKEKEVECPSITNCKEENLTKTIPIELIECPHCKIILDIEEFNYNNNSCTECNKTFEIK